MVSLTKKAAAVAEGIVEGDYTSWTHKWTQDFPGGLNSTTYLDFYIDERSDVLFLTWQDAALNWRFGIYKLSDFSQVFQSPAGSDYIQADGTFTVKWGFHRSSAALIYGSCSCSLQSYVLIERIDGHTIEVWRGESSVLWSHDVQDDEAGVDIYNGEISLQGKLILLLASNSKLILYEGS